MANPLPRSQCFSVAMQSLLFLCHAMLFRSLTVAIRFLANAGLALAVAHLVSAIPLRDPSALCRRAALLRLCTSLLGVASAFLTVTSPPRLSAMLYPCNPALCHADCKAHPSYAFAVRLVDGLCNATASLGSQCNAIALRHDANPSPCLSMHPHCDAPRSYTFATPLRAFPWRISSVQSKASAKQYLAPAQPYLAAAQLRRTV